MKLNNNAYDMDLSGESLTSEELAIRMQRATQTSLLDLSDLKVLPTSTSFLPSLAALPILSSSEYDFFEVSMSVVNT